VLSATEPPLTRRARAARAQAPARSAAAAPVQMEKALWVRELRPKRKRV
jgi:hypothetical protein